MGVAVASAAPQYGGYGHKNYFTGSKKPLRGQYSRCKVIWKEVNKPGYEERYEEKCEYVKVPVQDTKTECESGYEKRCENEWVCLDYPKQENLDYCQNKKWQPTNQGCKNLHTENCRDVPFTRYEDQRKCRNVHKQVPVQIKGKIAARVCPGQPEHEYTPRNQGNGFHRLLVFKFQL